MRELQRLRNHSFAFALFMTFGGWWIYHFLMKGRAMYWVAGPVIRMEWMFLVPIALLLGHALPFAAGMGFEATLGGQKWKELMPFKRWRLKSVPPMLLAYVGVTWAFAWMVHLMEPANVPAEIIPTGDPDGLSVAGDILFAGLIAPIFEEIFYRGTLQGSLARRGYPWLGIVLVSALFALSHGLFVPREYWLVRVVPTFALSIYLGWLFVRTGSLWPSILYHAMHNLDIWPLPNRWAELSWGWIPSICLIAVGVFGMNRAYQISEPAQEEAFADA